jgi:hypothetical protein
MIKDCLGPTPSHKTSSVFRPECGTYPLQWVRQYPLKEQNAVGGRATELSTPPYQDKIQSKDDSDSDLVSDEEGQEGALAHQA